MESREIIIKEAARMFAESGIKSVRMDDIVAACGISKRTLYELFDDRENFIRQSLYYLFEEQRNILKQRLEKASNVIDEFKIIFDHGPDFRNAIRRVMIDLIKFYPKIFEEFTKDHHKAVVEDNEQRLRRGIEQGLFLSAIDTEFIARSLISYLYGLHQDLMNVKSTFLLTTTSGMSDSNPETWTLAIMYFLRGLTTEKGRRYMDEKILKVIE